MSNLNLLTICTLNNHRDQRSYKIHSDLGRQIIASGPTKVHLSQQQRWRAHCAPSHASARYAAWNKTGPTIRSTSMLIYPNKPNWHSFFHPQSITIVQHTYIIQFKCGTYGKSVKKQLNFAKIWERTFVNHEVTNYFKQRCRLVEKVAI